MAKMTIHYVRMEPAKNGFTISYEERTEKKPTNGNTFDSCHSYKMCNEVYNLDGDDSEAQADKAFARFRELAMRQYSEMKEK